MIYAVISDALKISILSKDLHKILTLTCESQKIVVVLWLGKSLKIVIRAAHINIFPVF